MLGGWLRSVRSSTSPWRTSQPFSFLSTLGSVWCVARGRSFAIHASEEGANDAMRYVDAVQAANMIKWLCLDMLCQSQAGDCQCHKQFVMDSCACSYYVAVTAIAACALPPMGLLQHCSVARVGSLCRRSIQSMSWTISSTISSKMPVRGTEYAY